MTAMTEQTRAHLRRRRIANWLALFATFLATVAGLLVLGAILWTLCVRGLSGLSFDVFTQMTPAPGSAGGLLNAIVGSAIMTGIGIAIGTPVGIARRDLSGRIQRHPASPRPSVSSTTCC